MARYTDQEILDLERDALRWRALMSSQRIRMIGCAGFTKAPDGPWTPRKIGGGMHLGLEFWDIHPEKHPSEAYPQDECRQILETYVDTVAERNKRNAG